MKKQVIKDKCGFITRMIINGIERDYLRNQEFESYYDDGTKSVIRGYSGNPDDDYDTYLAIYSNELQFTAIALNERNKDITVYFDLDEEETVRIIEQYKDYISPKDYFEFMLFVTDEPICVFCGRRLSQVIEDGDKGITIARASKGGICDKCAEITLEVPPYEVLENVMIHPNWGNGCNIEQVI